jgi:phosphoribosylaminoimidazolecarboxamide formyltransferase/IMP cyclohydrolase
MKTRRALLSVSDKTGLVDFARGLAELGFELVTTGGTARALREAGLAVHEVSELTGHPEILDGRVKTLHPKVHGGILARRDRPDDMETLLRHGISPVDLVCVNLYPFEETAAREGVSDAEAREQIDVGGPALLRAAAKSWPDVIVVATPRLYGTVLAELRAAGDVSADLRRRLAAVAFTVTATYDQAIASWVGGRTALRYGENPHQKAYLEGAGPGRILSGKELSYTNLLDLDGAMALADDLPGVAACCIVKHVTPCGAAAGVDPLDAFERAYACDPLSAYGGTVAIRPAVTAAAAHAMARPGIFLECVIAPRFEEGAIEILTSRPRWGKSVRLVEAGPAPLHEERSIRGGKLHQTRDVVRPEDEKFEPKTSRTPTPEQEKALRFAIACAKHARSNAIALAAPGALLGIGAGQTSRVDAVRVAIEKAGPKARGAALASDAFFPFPDAIELARAAGVAAIAEPGGAKRDDEVIAACERAGIALVFTGVRHFRH